MILLIKTLLIIGNRNVEVRIKTKRFMHFQVLAQLKDISIFVFFNLQSLAIVLLILSVIDVGLS